MTVHFIGAGPGAPDLITVRGHNLVARCPVCLFAGSLVPREIIALCPPKARVIDTAPLDLDAITTEKRPEHSREPAALMQERIDFLFRYVIAAFGQSKGPVHPAQYNQICDGYDEEKQRRRRCPDDTPDLAVSNEFVA
jgi:hypothetical protein